MGKTTTAAAAGALVLVVLSAGDRPARAFIDLLPGSLAAECRSAHAVAVLRVEKVWPEKKAITYRMVRELKGTLPAFAGATFTHVLGPVPNPEQHAQDLATKDIQNDAILTWAGEGKTAVLFLGAGGATAVCVGHAWYTTRGLPPAAGPWVQGGSADSRLQRLYCGDAEELVAAVTALVAGKPGREVAVPRMVGMPEMVTDRSGPILRAWALPFPAAVPWSTHRGNVQRTGSDGGPGPKRPTVLGVYRPSEAETRNEPPFALPPEDALFPRPQGPNRWPSDAPIAVVAGRVLAASVRPDEEKAGKRALLALDAGDGSVLWKTPLRLNPWAGPTVGPYVLVGCSSIRPDAEATAGATGEVVALELDTGRVRWRKDVPGGVLSAVAVKAALAIFTATDGKVRALDAFTGREAWRYDGGAPFFAGPAVTRDMVYAADLRGVVHALRLADGHKEWVLDLAADAATRSTGGVYGPPLVYRGRLYLATADPGRTRGRAANAVVCIGDK
jgi:hypothetical protein